MASAIVSDERRNDALHVRTAFHIGLERVGLIVSARGVHLGTVVTDKDLAHRFGAGFLRAALRPQGTVVARLSRETKDAPVAAARTIGEGGGLTVGAGEQRALVRELKAVWGKAVGAFFIREQGRHQLSLSARRLGDLVARLARPGGGIIDELVWHEVVVLALGLKQIRDGDRVRLSAGVGLNLADKVVGDGQVDVVAEILFVVAMHPIRGVGIGGTAEPIAAFVVGGAFRHLGDLPSVIRAEVYLVGDDLVQVRQPLPDGRAHLGRKGHGLLQASTHQTRAGLRRQNGRLQAGRAFFRLQVILTEFVFRAPERREVKLSTHLGFARGVRFGQRGQQALARVTEESDE